jgi:hypothetical protein
MALAALDRCSIVLDVGGLSVRIETASAAMRGVLDQRFAGFAAPPPAAYDVTYDVVGQVPTDLLAPAAVRSEPHTVEATATGFAVRAASFSVDGDFTARRLTVRGPAAAYPLDAALRYLLPLLHPDGLVLHAAALVGDAGAWLCCGASGSGKSTLAELFPERTLCDELVLVRPHAGSWRAHALPYWRAHPGSAPLAGICLLRHGARNVRRRLAPPDALRRVTPTVSWPEARPDRLPDSLTTLVAVVEAVPVFELEFRPTRDVWDTLASGAT